MNTEIAEPTVKPYHSFYNLNSKHIKRFLSRIEITDSCWLWSAGKANHGYGVFRIGSSMWTTHRVSYIIFKGTIPKGLCVCHTCDNRLCVNPDHLWLGTKKDNTADMMHKSRMVVPRGESRGNAIFTNQQIIDMRNRYAEGGISQASLGREYGIASGHINHIIKRKYWSHI